MSASAGKLGDIAGTARDAVVTAGLNAAVCNLASNPHRIQQYLGFSSGAPKSFPELSSP